jgi:hypothetical protein
MAESASRQGDAQRVRRDVVQTIVRNKPLSVQNKGRHKPGSGAKLVADGLGVQSSNFSHHIAAWRYYEVRPDKHTPRPVLTDDRYCIWDEPHKDYLYTDAWVKKLINDLADPQRFEKVTVKRPIALPNDRDRKTNPDS